MLEGFPVRNDGRGVTARTWCVPAAALLDGRGRPPHSPCPRLPSCTFAPSQRAVGRLTPGRAWCRRSERWRGCSGRLRPSLRHAGGRCGGTQSALSCAVGWRLRASSAYIRCWAGRGAREAWARSTALRGRGGGHRRGPLGLHAQCGRAGAGAGAHRVYRRGRCPLLACSHFEQLVAGNVIWLSTVMPQSDGVDWLFSQPSYVYLKRGIVAQIVLCGIEAVHPVQCDASHSAALSGAFVQNAPYSTTLKVHSPLPSPTQTVPMAASCVRRTPRPPLGNSWARWSLACWAPQTLRERLAGFCRRHCTSQAADRSHGRVGCRGWPTVRGGGTSCIGRRYPTAKASKATVHLGLVAHPESCNAHLEIGAGK